MANIALFCSLVFLASLHTEAVKILLPFPNNAFAITGSVFDSTCIVQGDNGQPPLKVKFQRKGVSDEWLDIPDTYRVFQTNKTEGDKVIATLHIMNMTVKDDADFGRYSCVGLSSSGGASRLGFTVKVTPREDLPVARVVPNVTASYGDKVQLYCNLTHKNNEQTTPIERVTFLKNGIPVKYTSDVTQPLILPNVTARDGGNYSCKILVKLDRKQPYNIAPTMTAYLHIRVRFPFKESKIAADIGDRVALVCSAEGFPLNVTWNKNKLGSTTVIKPSGRFTLQGQCRNCPSILVIHNVTEEDSGNYSCSASDNPGQHVFLVTVRMNSTSSAPTTMASRALRDNHFSSILVDLVAALVTITIN